MTTTASIACRAGEKISVTLLAEERTVVVCHWVKPLTGVDAFSLLGQRQKGKFLFGKKLDFSPRTNGCTIMSDNTHGTLKQEGLIAQKGRRREEIVDRILDAMSDEEIYETLYLQRKSESEVKDRHFRVLLECLEDIHRDMGGVTKESSIKERARDSVLWEGNPKTTINNIKFMGVQHRPDFEIQFEDLKIAVEVKLGDKGSDIRGGLGQSLVYAEEFDFVAYLFVDTTKDKKIREGCQEKEEQILTNNLWNNYNIKFSVV